MNIPSVILELQEYRKKILGENIQSASGVPAEAEAEKILDGLTRLDEKNFETVRERTNHAFHWVFETFGYDEFRKMAIKMKSIPSLSASQYVEAKGELAEVFLYITIREWLRLKKRPQWKVYNHFWLPYVSGKGYTELDVVLASQYLVVVFECKSYNGRKVLTKECFLTPVNGKAIDVYKQNAHHCKALWEHTEPFALSDVGVMKSAFFEFAVGRMEDKRTADNKRLIPALNEDNILHFLSAIDRQVTRVGWKSALLDFMDDVAKTPYDAAIHISQFEPE